jgi:hypothetical protein
VNRGGNLSKSENPDARDIRRTVASRTTTDLKHRLIQGAILVGASALDVAGLLAAVAHALSGGLLGAVSGKMTDLAA